jgi:hypothetical protein
LAELVGVGYRPVSASFQLQLMAHLSRWLDANGLPVEELSPSRSWAAMVIVRSA